MICFMPETSKIQLPQTMAELKESVKQKKLKSKIDQVYEKDVEEWKMYFFGTSVISGVYFC